MAWSRAHRFRRQKGQQGHQQQQQGQLQESTTYAELLATAIPANSNQNADKVAHTLGIVQNVSYSPSSPTRNGDPGGDGEPASKLQNTALYHAAIKSVVHQPAVKMAAQSEETGASTNGERQTEVDNAVAESNETEVEELAVSYVAASANRNCGVTISNLPDGTTEPMILEAITGYKPGKVYACDVYIIPGPNNIPPARAVASLRFMRPESATRLMQIGSDPERGIFVKGKRAIIEFAHHHYPAYLLEPASRVVFFRGPISIVNPASLHKLWGIKEQTEKLIIRKVDGGLCEIEWHFCSYWYNAELAFGAFEEAYEKREDCSVWYGVDPCA